MITEPEYLEELEKLEEGEKNRPPSVAAKSRKRGKIRERNKKKKILASSSSEKCETCLSDQGSEENTSCSKS